MERVSESRVTVPRRPESAPGKDAGMAHINPTGPTVGSRYPPGVSTLRTRHQNIPIRLNAAKRSELKA